MRGSSVSRPYTSSCCRQVTLARSSAPRARDARVSVVGWRSRKRFMSGPTTPASMSWAARAGEPCTRFPIALAASQWTFTSESASAVVSGTSACDVTEFLVASECVDSVLMWWSACSRAPALRLGELNTRQRPSRRPCASSLGGGDVARIPWRFAVPHVLRPYPKCSGGWSLTAK
eukprot:scaffold43937_cov61-Phaeocystis_antarctica.AAC.3